MKAVGRAQLLAMAMGTGLAAALLAYLGLARQTQGAGTHGVIPLAVVVAARDLPARCPLTSGMLRIQRLLPPDVPPGTVGTPEALLGQVTTAEIAAGRPVLRGMLTTRGASPGMAGAVAPSRRAVSVALDPVSGVTGFLEPGDHVDVLATFGTWDTQEVTRTILQNARLLAIGSRTGMIPPTENTSEEKPASSATLEVTPAEAQALALAAARGKMQLVLRGLGDTGQSPITDLLSEPSSASPSHNSEGDGQKAVRSPRSVPREWGARKAAPKDQGPAPPKPLPSSALPQIKVIRGTEMTTVTVGE